MILNVWIKSDGLVEINRITSTILTLIGKFPVHELDWFMENSSKIKHLDENHISWILGRDTGRITGKLIQTISQFLKFLEFIWENKGRKNLYL